MTPPSPSIWIIGGGRFGGEAALKLSEIHSPENVLVVDSDPEALSEITVQGIQKIQADGLDFLLKNLDETTPPRWVIPCVPFHLAYQWLLGRLEDRAGMINVPKEFAADLPNPLDADGGGVFLSYADFLCPPDCPEPADTCTFTGKPRKGNLYETVADQAYEGLTAIVIRSRQLAPGLGGIRPSDLFGMKNAVERRPGRYIIATCCRCHGVVHGLEIV